LIRNISSDEGVSIYITLVGEDTVTQKRDRTRFIPALCAIAAAAMLISCSGTVDDPAAAEKKLIAAYGGADKVKLLQNYTGKGFMKDLSSQLVAKSAPLDIYQKGELYKAKITKLQSGKPAELLMTIYNGQELYQWIYGRGKKDIPLWELYINKYKFPNILEWIQKPDIEGTLSTTGNGGYRLHYEHETDIIDLTLDGKSWLLEEMRVTSKADTSFFYSEAYSDYRDVDGIPFPNRFTGTYKDRPYYEYMIPVIEYGVEIPDSIFSVLTADTTYIARVLAEARAQGGE
jgi:hypothetical protein